MPPLPQEGPPLPPVLGHTPSWTSGDVLLWMKRAFETTPRTRDAAEIRPISWPNDYLDTACRDFIRPGWKSLWCGRGCPEAADLVAECRFVLLPVEIELTRIESVLNAEVYDTGATADERREVLARVDDALAEMRAGDGPISQRTDEEVAIAAAEMARTNERFRDRARAQAEASGRGQAMWGRLPISDELASKIGLVVPVLDDAAEEV